METRGGGGELAKMLFVFGHEEDAKFAEHAVGSSTIAPQITSKGEGASGFEKEESEIHEHGIGEGITASSSNALHFVEAFPESFNGFRRGPKCANAGTIGFEFSVSDGTICRMEMGEHV